MDPTSSTAVTKRLHISGLTPSLTTDDLVKRLSMFGTVTAVDGFGKRDAVGALKPFGYVTIEATPAQLARCRNVLSGSTWKGAKLRIGDAKPDFAERMTKEREEEELKALNPPPAKKPRLSKYSGIQAPDMSLITPENVSSHPGWILTPTGRVLRPMRMRPARPLPPPTTSTTTVKPKTDDPKKKTRRREKQKAPLVRARKIAIDTRRWEGSTPHLKGALLDGLVSVTLPSRQRAQVENSKPAPPSHASPSPSPLAEEVVGENSDDSSEAAVQAIVDPPTQPAGPPDLVEEKNQSLGLLASMFSGADEDWGGAESVGSDIDDGDIPQSTSAQDVEFEIVPRPKPTESNSLKDMFKPRQDEGKFSLLDHLGLDELEMDEDVAMPFTMEEDVPAVLSSAHEPIIAIPSQPHIILDVKKALFFPHTSSFSSGRMGAKQRTRDIFDVAREQEWTSGLLSTGGFHRTASEADIRAKWEENKGELTVGWRRRSKEAGKVRRRRGGGADDAE